MTRLRGAWLVGAAALVAAGIVGAVGGRWETERVVAWLIACVGWAAFGYEIARKG